MTKLRLGLPAWAFPGWRGTYFHERPSALASYATVFNAVEGNTTFYRVPDRNTVASWARAVAERDFRFSFKLPKTVTHQRTPSMEDLSRFLKVLDPLAGNLGPLLLQLPATVGPDDLGSFRPVFDALPTAYQYVLEVRHRAFFDDAQTLQPTLDRYGFGRAVMDTRALYHGDRTHPEVLAALHEKPDVPVVTEVHHGLAFVRLVLHPDRRDNQRYIDEWVARFAGMLQQPALSCFMMIHCPNNQHCPELAASFHEALSKLLPSLEPLVPWPVPQQQTLI